MSGALALSLSCLNLKTDLQMTKLAAYSFKTVQYAQLASKMASTDTEGEVNTTGILANKLPL